jgi:phosphomannomutase
MTIDTSIFKSYDIRGIYPTQADEQLANQIARCFAKYLNYT